MPKSVIARLHDKYILNSIRVIFFSRNISSVLHGTPTAKDGTVPRRAMLLEVVMILIIVIKGKLLNHSLLLQLR